MLLKELNLKYKYRSDNDSIYKDFYESCLKASVKYDRAVGYFTSGSLSLLAKGLDVFLENKGKIRIICNPLLSQEDLEAINKGYKIKANLIEKSMLKEIENLIEELRIDTLNTLAWLISEDILEIKVAYTNNNSIYHEKFGIFEDSTGDTVAFSGSSNETIGGMKNNFEKIDVFTHPRDSHRIIDMQEDFNKLWNNQTNGLTVSEVPGFVLQEINKYKSKKPTSENITDVKPRSYQSEAIKRLRENGWHGILEMATGTGKTITSLLAVQEYKNIDNRAFVIIFAPFKHLVDQWEDEVKKISDVQITLCYESIKLWKDQLKRDVRNFNLGVIDYHVVITTYTTASNEEFLKQVSKINKNAILIADECHYLGSNQFKKINLENIQARIGLSATPQRWFDDDGTRHIEEFFNGIVYKFGLDEAIDSKMLTPYYYEPHVIFLSESELDDYLKITRKIIKLINSDKSDEDSLNKLYRRRALIISKASGKIPRLLELLKEQNIDEISHTIVYCAEREVNLLTKELNDLGLRVHKFDSTVKRPDRKKILQLFNESTIQILVAIKCLDEGVDIPSTKNAYFLASTSNPREFVQRRGRILRNAPGKNLAYIHDFIVFPQNVDYSTFKLIASKELPRFAEFSSSAINTSHAKNKLFPLISSYNLNHLLNMKPWDVYKELYTEDGEIYDN